MSSTARVLAAALVLLALGFGISWWLAKRGSREIPSVQITRSPEATSDQPSLPGSNATTLVSLDETERSVAPNPSRISLEIRGVVLAGEQPLNDASIAFEPVSAGPQEESANGTRFTNQKGEFTITTASTGEYKLVISKDGYGEQNAVARAGDFVRVRLGDGVLMGYLVGTVTDSQTGDPVRAFSISVQRSRKDGWQALSQARTFTGETGRFEYPVQLRGEPANLSVSFQATGHKQNYVSVSGAKPGARVDLGVVPMETFEGVFGLVVDATTNAPIVGATVTPVTTGAIEGDQIHTDSMGRFSIEQITGSQLIGIMAAASGWGTDYCPYESRKPTTPEAPLVLALAKEAKICGKLTSDSGQSIDDVTIGYWSDAGAASRWPGMPRLISKAVKPQASGDYVLDAVPSMPIIVGLRRGGGRGIGRYEQLRVVTCEPGEQRRLDFAVDAGCGFRTRFEANHLGKDVIMVAEVLDQNMVLEAMIEGHLDTDLELDGIPFGSHTLRVRASRDRQLDSNIHLKDGVLDLGAMDVRACFPPR